MKELFSLLFFLHVFAVLGQNYNYNFGTTPQAAMLNPSYDIKSEKHFTIPLIGSIQLKGGISGITPYDIFADNAVPFQDKVESAVYNLSSDDILQVNQRMEFANLGYRLDSDTYLSFGLYEEMDFYSTIPIEFLQLFFEGTSFPGKQYSIDNLVVQSDLLTVYHVGLQKNVTSDLSIGGRFKLYNEIASISSKSNSATIQTNLVDNVYSHGVNNVDFTIQTSGIGLILDEENKIVRDANGIVIEDNKGNLLSSNDYINAGYIGKKVFFNGSKGIGVDLGVTYNLQENVELAASIFDLGFIYNSKQARSYTYSGDFTTESLAFEYDPDRPLIYVDRLIEELDENLPLSVDKTAYFSLRPFQLYTSLKYSFGMKRNNVCEYYKSVSYNYASSVGAVLHAQNRPDQILYNASVFYERSFKDKVYARVNYSVDKFNYTNLGLAVSANFRKVNIYAGMNNLLGIGNIAKVNNVSASFGLNLMMR